MWKENRIIGYNNENAGGNLPITPVSTYTITNGVTDRSYNADSTTVGELADVLYTLIVDLQTQTLVNISAVIHNFVLSDANNFVFSNGDNFTF